MMLAALMYRLAHPPRRRFFPGWICLTGLVLSLLGGCTDDPPPLDVLAHCPPREPLPCGLDIGGVLPQEIEGRTDRDAEDMFSGSDCGAGGVGIEDRAFVFTAARNGPFTFSTEGSRFDTLISVREEGCDGYELACDDAQVRGGAAFSEVTVELRECQSVTVIVDGHDFWSDGRFTLTVSGTETVCGDRRDDDGDGLVDCDDPDCLGANCDDQMMQWPIDAAQLEWRMLEIVNQRRSEGAMCGEETLPPAQPVEMNVTVREAARLHSQDMARQGYFDHMGRDGRSPGERIRDAGFTGSAPLGENIQMGAATAERAMESLMNSPGHCRNIMDPGFRVMGVGFANDGTAGGNYWTQNFAGSH